LWSKQAISLSAERKLDKYFELEQNCIFQPIAVENLGALSTSASAFVSTIGRHISSLSGEERETAFLFQ